MTPSSFELIIKLLLDCFSAYANCYSYPFLIFSNNFGLKGVSKGDLHMTNAVYISCMRSS